MRRRAVVVGVAAVLSTSSAASRAQDYPSRPIRFVVPYAPGGPADLIARTLAEPLGARLGQPVIVENRPGASGAIGADAVAKSKPDGHTLLLSNIGDTVSVAVGTKMPYDLQRDLAPVTLLGATPFVLVVGPGVQATNVGELVRYARANPRSINFGSAGTGSASQLAGELLKAMADMPATHLPYKGQAPATADLVGGHLTFMFSNPVTALPQIRSGALRALAVSGRQRFNALPEVPTIAESGVPDYDVTAWFGAMVASGTPEPIVARLADAMRAALAMPDVREKLEHLGVQPAGTTPAEFGRLIASEIERWSRVAKAANIRLD